MDDWFQLTRRYPKYQTYSSLTLLKDYGAMRCMAFLEDRFGDQGNDVRVLEFGHGFSPEVMTCFQGKHDVWGVDENQGLAYFETDDWDRNYEERVVKPCPDVTLVRGLLASDEFPVDLPAASFDVVYSISVLEEVPIPLMRDIVAAASALLKPGGWLIGTHDVNAGAGVVNHVPFADRIRAYFDAHTEVGLSLGDVPDPGRIEIEWQQMLLEHPAIVMLAYQAETPEAERTYGGHWGTLFTAAQKTGTP